MHLIWRYDVFRFTQNDVASSFRNDVMFAQCAVKYASLGKAVIIGRCPTSFKNAPLSIDKSAFLLAD